MKIFCKKLKKYFDILKGFVGKIHEDEGRCSYACVARGGIQYCICNEGLRNILKILGNIRLTKGM